MSGPTVYTTRRELTSPVPQRRWAQRRLVVLALVAASAVTAVVAAVALSGDPRRAATTTTVLGESAPPASEAASVAASASAARSLAASAPGARSPSPGTSTAAAKAAAAKAGAKGIAAAKNGSAASTAPAGTGSTSTAATSTTGTGTAGTGTARTSTTSTSKSAAGTPAAALPPVSSVAPGRRGLLNAIAGTLTDAQVDAIPQTYGVVVLNQWQSAAAHRIKQLDPTVVVLMYQCLSSMRTNDDATHRSGGVFPSQVAANPQWYATDTAGKHISWPYDGHWQMAVWDTAYQQTWTDNVVADAVAGGWDGVLADNDMSTLSWYNDALLAGAPSHAETDAKLRDGESALITRAGTALNAKGKRLVVNISDGRLYPGRWASHSRFGGGMEENFVHFGTSTTSGWVGDWGADGWMAQTDETRSPGLSVMITRASPGDDRTLLYGYASMLVRSDADAFWMPSTQGSYSVMASIPQMSWPLGPATGDPVRTASGAWTRQYKGVWVAVNPTAAGVSVTAPAGLASPQSGPVQLGPYSATLLRMG